MSEKVFLDICELILHSCITSSQNQENTRLLQGSGPTRNILECSLVPNVTAPLYSTR